MKEERKLVTQVGQVMWETEQQKSHVVGQLPA